MTSLPKTTSAAKWSALDVFMRQGVQFVVSIVLARILVPEDFGVIAMLALFIGVASIFIDSGFSAALIQRQTQHTPDESTVFFLQSGDGGGCCVIAVRAARLDHDVLQAACAAISVLCDGIQPFVGAFGSIHIPCSAKR
jgi:hypothetical protein